MDVECGGHVIQVQNVKYLSLRNQTKIPQSSVISNTKKTMAMTKIMSMTKIMTMTETNANDKDNVNDKDNDND